MIGKTNAIAQTSGNDDFFRELVERKTTHFEIPEGTTTIGMYAFCGLSELTSVIIPNSVTSIQHDAFAECTSLESVEIPGSVKNFGSTPFRDCGLKNVILNEGIISLPYGCFRNCKNLTEITLPSTLIQLSSTAFVNTNLRKVNIPKSLNDISVWAFQNCPLEEVTIEDGFNGNNLDLSFSTLYSVETIVSWFEALADRTGQTTYKLTIGADNLAKLTEEQIAIATAKNWTLA